MVFRVSEMLRENGSIFLPFIFNRQFYPLSSKIPCEVELPDELEWLPNFRPVSLQLVEAILTKSILVVELVKANQLHGLRCLWTSLSEDTQTTCSWKDSY